MHVNFIGVVAQKRSERERETIDRGETSNMRLCNPHIAFNSSGMWPTEWRLSTACICIKQCKYFVVNNNNERSLVYP